LKEKVKGKWVAGEGNLSAKIVLVGEAPGQEEEVAGRPFVGAAGNLLRATMRQAGLLERDVYITNVVKVRPPQNKLERLEELGVRVEDFYPLLFSEIDAINPNVIVALGEVALNALTGLKGVTNWRGSILRGRREVGERKVVPALHPAYILRVFKERVLLVLDLKRVKEESVSPLIEERERLTIIEPTLDNVREWVAMCEKEEMVAFDIETDAEGIISSIGFAFSPTLALSIPFAKGWDNYWEEDEEVRVWLELRRLFRRAWGDLKIVAHNALFDVKRVYRKTGYFPVWMDTMWAHQLLFAELAKGLDLCASIYTKEPFYKNERKVWKDVALWRQRGEYNCKDALVTWEVAKKLERELEAVGQSEFFFGHVMPLFHVLLWMEEKGIRVDRVAYAEMVEEVSRRRKEIEERLRPLGVLGKKGVSSKKTMELLYEEMKLPKQFNRKTGRLTANRKALEKLRVRVTSEVLSDILEFRRLSTLEDNFMKAEVAPDRFHTSFSFTETGRLSSHESELEEGTHLQNVPPSVRRIFIADEGMTLVEVDKSQAEARVVAWLSGDERMKEVFRSGGDIHKRVASMIFGKREEDVTSEERSLAKRMVHATNYCQGTNTMAEFCGVSVGEARKLRERYFATFPGVLRWQRRVAETLMKRGRTLLNPFGRRRLFLGRMAVNRETGEPELNDTVREAIAFLPQSTVVDDVNMGMTDLFYMMEGEMEVLHQVHDSILVQVKDEVVEEWVRRVKRVMEREIWVEGERVVIPVEVKVGKNWGEMKKVAV